jgi:hypothetical protein
MWGRLERAVDRNGLGLSLDAKIIEELCRGGSGRLKVPCLIKHRMMARFDNTRGCVKVHYVLIGGGIPQEDTGEIVAV